MSREKARSIIESLVERYAEHQKEYHHPDYNEQKTRQDFINPFFKALGWDIDNEKGDSEAYREVIYEDKVKVKGKAKAPDYGFRLSGSGNKRLFYLEAKKPSIKIKVHADSAYQLRRYGSSAQVPVSILTNFEDFVIYDCTRVPKVDDSATVSRVKHISFKNYVEEFDFIYDTFSHEAVTKGRFDKFVQSGATKRGTDTLDKRFVQSLDEWRKYLATNIAQHNRKLNDEELNYAVQQTLDRLIFLRFCEDRSVEPYAQMQKVVAKGDAYKALLHLFREADAKYNSGLFDFEKDTITPHLKMDPKVIRSVIGEMYYPQCNFEFSVMPVEILGNAYEQFLGKVIRVLPSRAVRIEEKPEVRKAGGVYYTPQYIVEYIVKNTVGKLIEGKTPKEIEKIKIVDPACGSGSFLLGAFDYLLRYHTEWYHHNGFTAKKGKDNPFTPQGTLTTHEKKRILRSNIYGVDLDANAVEVSKLSLLLKCMEGETEASMNQQMTLYHERVLPNLDDNIKDGNSLIDTDFYDTEMDLGYEKKVKPFSWKKAFPEVFKQGGFDAVVGNPPYVQSREGQLGEQEKKYYYQKYKTAEFQLNTFGLFIEKGLNLLKPKMPLGFIIPNYWLATQYDKKLRKFLFQQNSVSEITNVYKVFDSAVVDTLMLIAYCKNDNKNSRTIIKSIDRNIKSISERLNNINNEKWAFNYEFTSDKKQDDIEISFHQSIKLQGKKKIGDYFNLKFGAKLYEVGKGNPPQTKADSENSIYESTKKEDGSYRKLLKGRHIKRFIINWKNDWVKYGSNLAAPRNHDLFIGDRILIQRIVSHPQLDATFTNADFICNTDVITLKPKTKIDCKFFLAILNSSLCGTYIRSINVNLDRDAFPKINTNTLEDFPVPDVNKVEKSKHNEIIKHVDLLLQLNEELKEAKLPTRQEQIKQRIDHSEDKINRLVYELYELTEDEIKIIEDSIK